MAERVSSGVFVFFFGGFRAGALAGAMAAAVLALLALGGPTSARADKPEWAGTGKHGDAQPRHRQADSHGGSGGQPLQAHAAAMGRPRVEIRIGGYFGEQQRMVVHRDHVRMVRAGHCPPGLAKKGQGCQPPGQAQKPYRLGQPLPPGVVYYELPPMLAVQLGAPPPGHRFVRVAADILLIAVGTSMVIDAIEDLGR